MDGSFSFSIFGFNLPAYIIWLGSIIISLYLCYRWALPKPIPGIPYNKEAAGSLFGDIGPMVKRTAKTNELYDWMTAQNIKLQPPIIQLFIRPLGKPWVVITDFREAQDVLVRRTKEFDKSDWLGNVSGGVMPESVMGIGFLHNVAVPHIYNVYLDLLQLWQQKSRLAQGHPFAAAYDINRAALDAIWTIVFGADSSNSTTKTQLEFYSPIKAVDLPNHKDAEVVLPRAPCPSAIQSIIAFTQSIETSLKSPVPRLAHWALRQTSAMKNAFSVKEEFIKEEIEKALQRFKGKLEKECDVRCAVDDILRREILLAEKEGRVTALHSRGIYDEILSLLIAAHDATSTSITWALKLLADNPDVQDKLRSELQFAHADAVVEKRQPTAQEITNTTIHYRDAVVEEIFRCSLTEAAIGRTAVVDTKILGHHIPKGTEVFFMGNGLSLFSAAFHIDDSQRSQAYFAIKEKVCSWDPENMVIFNPDRWLTEEDGQKVFDAAAGPLLTFGLGERGCYGRKIAYVEIKLFITLIVWNFELHKCPELSGYQAIDKLVHAPQQCYVKLVKLI
ncbi:cytochrome P450 [Bisporella sp. PMI_857]|nr:cytochrome P450 [Bisporella sp. PMI_857]